jgi:PAS domain S-box-containing protein
MDKKKPSYKNELDLIGVELAKEKKEKGKIEKELFKLKVEFDILRAEKANREIESENINNGMVVQGSNEAKQAQNPGKATVEINTNENNNKITAQYARSLLEASLDPLVTISSKGKITDVNEASVDVTGVKRDELIGSDFSSYFTEPQKAQEGYERVFKNGFVSDYPLTIKNINGKLTDVLYNATVYKDSDGIVLGVFAAARDVTIQKLLSNYSRSLLEASRDPLFVINHLGKITDLNNACAKITHQTRAKLIGSDFIDYFTEPEKARQGYKEVFVNGFVEDFPLTIKDGKLTPALFNGAVYKDDNGNVLGAMVIARVIIEQKRFEKELTEARVFAELATEIAEVAKAKAESATQIAENAVRAKQQFLSNMSHEIRTPMNAIIGFTKVVLKTDLTEKQKEYLKAIKISGDALIVLINDILDLAKVDAGKMTFEQVPFNMELSISAMLQLFETKVHEKNLTLTKKYDDRIPKTLSGDSVRLHQIILNLVSNAVKFTDTGQIIVGVQMLDENDDTVKIKFSVTDTGIGITANKITSIFENFQQATSSTSRIYGGTGLGLAIVKQLVESQGGSINVNSKLGEGSTFSFILDFHKTDLEAEIRVEISELDTGMKNIRVLVVEDIPLNQLLMKTLLDDFGFESEVAAHGLIAVEKLKAMPFDIVLMDLQMPEMNGFEATDYIRNVMHSSIPIIALTADVTTMDLEKCKDVGMNDYLAKPVDEKLLFNKIISLVRSQNVVNEVKSNLNDNEAGEYINYIDLTYLSQKTKSNPLLMMEMISLYLEQTPPLILSMKKALLEKNWNLLYSAVHKMIPSFSIIGLNSDFEIMAKKIQDYASTKKQTEEIHEMVLKLEEVCNHACIQLTKEFTKLKNSNK